MSFGSLFTLTKLGRAAMLKVLVVDDNEEFCQNVKDIMELEGHKVLTAYDGLKAVELVKKEKPDLVLMDVKLPRMDGVTAFRKIKEIAPETPVIMMTAYAVEELVRDALREGAFGSLKKPLELDRLIPYIENAIPGGTRVLVVDDDEGFCTNIKEVLEEKGYQVSVAYNGDSAIEKAWESDFDIILMDLKLPSLNGLETYLVIREIRPKAKVIMITGYPQAMRKLAEEAVRKSAYTWLEKPVDINSLLSLLEQIKVR